MKRGYGAMVACLPRRRKAEGSSPSSPIGSLLASRPTPRVS